MTRPLCECDNGSPCPVHGTDADELAERDADWHDDDEPEFDSDGRL